MLTLFPADLFFVRSRKDAGNSCEQARSCLLLGRLAGGCRRGRDDSRNRRNLSGFLVLDLLGNLRLVLGFGQRVADTGVLRQIGLVVAHASHLVVRRFKRGVGDQDDLGVMA